MEHERLLFYWVAYQYLPDAETSCAQDVLNIHFYYIGLPEKLR